MITTKEVQKMMSTDPKLKLDLRIKLDVECIQDDSDMGTADALRHIQRKIKVRTPPQWAQSALQHLLGSINSAGLPTFC